MLGQLGPSAGSVMQVEELNDGDTTDEERDKIFLPPGIVSQPPMPSVSIGREHEFGQVASASSSHTENGQGSNGSPLPDVSQLPGQPTTVSHSSEGSESVKDITKCGMQDLVALEFAEMERMITTCHRKVLQLIGNSGKEGDDPATNNGSAMWTRPPSAQAHTPFGGSEREPLKVVAQRSLPNGDGTGVVQSLQYGHLSTGACSPRGLKAANDFLGHLTVTRTATTDLQSTNVEGHLSIPMPGDKSPKPSFVTKFEVLPCWNRKTDEYTKAAMAGTKRGSADFFETDNSIYRQSVGLLFDGSEPKVHHFGTDLAEIAKLGRYDLQRFVIHPCSAKRATWDTCSLMLVVYDIAFLPLQFFEPEDDAFTTMMSWITRIFWSVDLPMSFFTGYLLSDGFIMMKLKHIAWHYLKTWFVLDVLLIVCDWAEFVIAVIVEDAKTEAGEATGVGRLGKAGRIARILRMIRLLRMARMSQVIRLFTFRLTSEKLNIIADIVKCLASIVAVAHLLACIWYGICNTNTSGSDSWIVKSGAKQKPVGYKYMLSLHWSLSQFQGGMDEFRASSFPERAFNVVVFLFAFMMAAVCVSGLTSSMTRLHLLTSHQSRQISILRRYLIQNGISDKLALRVQRNALHAISEQQRLMAENKVELLQAISEPLRVELHFEMYGPVLEVHPFFEAYVNACPHVMHHICHKAMATLLVSNGDVIFNIGEIPEMPRMYIVCNGHFEYCSAWGETTTLIAKDFLAEAALWTHWMHRGVLRALMDGRLCVMNCKRFQELVRQFDHPHFDPRHYAKEYVKSLNEKTDEGDQITDLPLGSESDLKDVAAMSRKKPDSKRDQMKSIFHITKKQVDFISTSILPGGPRRMMDGGQKQRRQSVLFTGARDKMPKSPQLLRFNSNIEGGKPAVATKLEPVPDSG